MKSRSTITRGEADTDTTTSTTTAEGAGWTTGATGTATGAATTEEATGTEAAGAAAVTSGEGATAVGEAGEAAGATSEITITETNATEETTEEMTAGTTVGTTEETTATGTSESGAIIESNTNTARTTGKSSSSSSTTSAATTTGNVVVAEAAAAARRGVAVGRTEVAAEGAERISSSSRTSPRHLLRRGPEARARSVRAIRGSRANNSSKARPSIRLSRRRPPIGEEGGVVAAEDVEVVELAAEEAALAMVSHLPPSLNYLSLY